MSSVFCAVPGATTAWRRSATIAAAAAAVIMCRGVCRVQLQCR